MLNNDETIRNAKTRGQVNDKQQRMAEAYLGRKNAWGNAEKHETLNAAENGEMAKHTEQNQHKRQ